MTGPMLSPSVIIGLGEWGRSVAAGAEAALKERSPGIARACPVLLLADQEPAAVDLVRAHLRASRMAELIRTLELEGLMQLDPVVAPRTYVYLVGADPLQIEWTADLVEGAARELQATISLVALTSAMIPDVRFPAYLIQPITSRGLILSADEFRAAAVELLVAVGQPGGSQLLADRRPGMGALGIAWLDWSPADIRGALAQRLSREAILHGLATLGPGPGALSEVKETPVWRATQERLQGLLKGLPFRPLVCIASATLEPSHTLFESPLRRHHKAVYLRRCAAVLHRRVERWERLLTRNGAAQAEREEGALSASLTQALAAGPDGFSRAYHLVERLTDQAVQRLDCAPPQPMVAQVGPQLARLEKAEALPPLTTVAVGLAIVMLLFSLIGWLTHPAGSTYVALAGFLGLVGLGYHGWRPRHIEKVAESAWLALCQRSEQIATEMVQDHLAVLDQAMEARCTTTANRLDQTVAELRDRCGTASADGGAWARGGALHLPLVGGTALAGIYKEIQPHIADLAAHLSLTGCFHTWREPTTMLARCEESTRTYLTTRLRLEPGHLAAQAYGERLGERLNEAVRGLIDWSAPLLVTNLTLPEASKWLVWPESMPCPPVGVDVNVIHAAHSCAAVITVIPSLPPLPKRHPASSTA